MADVPTLNASEQRVLRLCQLCGACASLVACCVCLWLMRRRLTCGPITSSTSSSTNHTTLTATAGIQRPSRFLDQLLVVLLTLDALQAVRILLLPLDHALGDAGCQVMGLLQVWVETTLIGWHVFVSACCLVIVTHRSAVKTLQQRLPLAVATAAVLGLCVSLCVLSLGRMGPSVLGCWIGDAFVQSQLATLAALVLSAWVAMCSISIRVCVLLQSQLEEAHLMEGRLGLLIRRVRSQGLLYSGAFLLVWLLPLVSRALLLASGHVGFGWVLGHGLSVSLLGLLDAWVYGHVTYASQQLDTTEPHAGSDDTHSSGREQEAEDEEEEEEEEEGRDPWTQEDLPSPCPSPLATYSTQIRLELPPVCMSPSASNGPRRPSGPPPLSLPLHGKPLCIEVQQQEQPEQEDRCPAPAPPSAAGCLCGEECRVSAWGRSRDSLVSVCPLLPCRPPPPLPPQSSCSGPVCCMCPACPDFQPPPPHPPPSLIPITVL